MSVAVANRICSASIASAASGLVIALLVAFAVLDMVLFGVTIVERVAYVAIYAGAIIAIVALLRSGSVDRRTWSFTGAWLLAVTFWLLPTVQQTISYPSYVLGDMLTLALPVLLMFGGSAARLFSGTPLRVLTVGLLVAAILAPLLGSQANRFEPPSTLLVALVWVAVLHVQGLGRRAALVGVAAGLLVLAFMSGQRTALIVWVGCAGFVSWTLTRGRPLRMLCLVVGTLVLVAVTASTLREQAVGLLAGHRASGLAEGERDESLLSRVDEAFDVLATVRREGSALTYVTGFGHGATYRPDASFMARNVTAEGRVHNVHLGPLMIFFRYGLLGIAAYVWLLAVTVRVALRSSAIGSDQEPAVTALALASGAYLVEGLMFNVWVDPLFSFALAGLLAGLNHADAKKQRAFRSGTLNLGPPQGMRL